MIVNALLFAVISTAPVVVADVPASSMRLDCSVALMMPQGQLTAPTPVTVSFTAAGKALTDIHVVDTGGILYPGGNMRMVDKGDAVALESVPVPAELPGTWSGKVEKKLYRLTLRSDALAKAAEIGIGRQPGKDTGRLGMIWNATNQPSGLPKPISGSGVGQCTSQAKDSQ